MKNPFVRWWVTFWIIIMALITALVGGIGPFILESDKTYLSWGILGVFMIGSFLLGKRAYKQHRFLKKTTTEWPEEYAKIFKQSDFGTIDYCIETLTSLGLLGTIIGLIIMIVGAFSNLDVSNQGSVKEALVAMSSGIGTALVTTLVGLVSAMLLKFQLMVTKGG